MPPLRKPIRDAQEREQTIAQIKRDDEMRQWFRAWMKRKKQRRHVAPTIVT